MGCGWSFITHYALHFPSSLYHRPPQSSAGKACAGHLRFDKTPATSGCDANFPLPDAHSIKTHILAVHHRTNLSYPSLSTMLQFNILPTQPHRTLNSRRIRLRPLPQPNEHSFLDRLHRYDSPQGSRRRRATAEQIPVLNRTRIAVKARRQIIKRAVETPAPDPHVPSSQREPARAAAAERSVRSFLEQTSASAKQVRGKKKAGTLLLHKPLQHIPRPTTTAKTRPPRLIHPKPRPTTPLKQPLPLLRPWRQRP